MEGLDAILYDYINSLPEDNREEETEFLFNYLTTEELDDFLRKWKKSKKIKNRTSLMYIVYILYIKIKFITYKQ